MPHGRADAKGSSAQGAPLLAVGTSGWAYREWRSWWYPRSLPTREWLRFYAEHFTTVELNSTFYRLPPPERFRHWAQNVPAGFRFAVKAPRGITHERLLQADPEAVHTFIASTSALGEHLGPLLWQIPPRLARDIQRLSRFLSLLPAELEHAMEFRHPSWGSADVWELLQTHGVAVVWSSSARYPCFLVQTAPFLYIRFHGLAGGYAHRYTDAELAPWVERTVDALHRGQRVYAYFNNTAGSAPLDAQRFQELVYHSL